jgi:hypothetical protein
MVVMETTVKRERDSPAPALGNEGNGSAVVYNSESSTEEPCQHPALCMRCKDEYFIFKMPGHPDDGRLLACGIMLENIREGCMDFACCYFTEVSMTRVDDQVFCTMPGRTCMCNPDTHGACGKIIDAEEANEALLLVEQLKAVH